MSREPDRALNALMDLAGAVLIEPCPNRARQDLYREAMRPLLAQVRRGSKLVDRFVGCCEALCEKGVVPAQFEGSGVITGAAFEAKSCLAELYALRAVRWSDARGALVEQGF